MDQLTTEIVGRIVCGSDYFEHAAPQIPIRVLARRAGLITDHDGMRAHVMNEIEKEEALEISIRNTKDKRTREKKRKRADQERKRAEEKAYGVPSITVVTKREPERAHRCGDEPRARPDGTD